MSVMADELRQLRKEVARLNRKLSLQRVPGTVVERANGKVKLELGEDPVTGKKSVSPWVRVQTLSAGAFKAFVLPSIGEQMYLESPSGIIGADSVATYGTFTDANPAPESEDDEMVIITDDAKLSIRPERIAVSKGDHTVEVQDGIVRGHLPGDEVTRPRFVATTEFVKLRIQNTWLVVHRSLGLVASGPVTIGNDPDPSL